MCLNSVCATLNRLENRESFEALLEKLEIPQPKGKAVTNIEDGVAAAAEIGYPVLVRQKNFMYWCSIRLWQMSGTRTAVSGNSSRGSG